MKTLKFSLFILTLFLYSLVGFAKTLVISDIDDTIKKANSMGGIGGVYHFLRKKPYKETRDLFNEIKVDEISRAQQISYYYVSAAPSYTFDADEWIKEERFPIGKTYLKTRDNGGETYAYKYRTIKNILDKEGLGQQELKIIFFGDNSQHDAQVYFDLKKDLNLNAEIFVRDVSTEATFFDTTLPVVRLPGVNYFFSEMDLIGHPSFLFMGEELKAQIASQYTKRDLIPPYTLDTLEDRLKEICKNENKLVMNDFEELISKCKKEAKAQAAVYWDGYHSR